MRVALVGIALLGAGSMALIAWSTRDAPAAGAAGTETTARSGVAEASGVEVRVADDPAPGASLPVAGVAPASLSPGVPPAPTSEAPAPARRTISSPGERPASQRKAQVSFRRALQAGLAALERRIAECGASGASFSLDLSAVDAGVRIEGARVQARGSAGEASLACARAALVGSTIAAPSVQPGRRWQMPFAPGAAL